jgi:ethanolamine ammonia-lyase small subunit
MGNDPAHPDPFAALRLHTHARIGLGRRGQALPTAPMLAFQLDHARARDAVHAVLDVAALRAAIAGPCIDVHSAAANRATYLQNPDLGRRLRAEDAESLRRSAGFQPASFPAPGAPLDVDVVFVAADGLSATAVRAHAPALIDELTARLTDWKIAPVVIARQARVALGDEIGERLGAAMVVMLIGERPGLSAPDSLGAYLTWAPRVGRRDSERNCVSNIGVQGGLAHGAAADKIVWLMRQARRLSLTGVDLKDAEGAALTGPERGRLA